jgi:tRNA threonylcarbamoyl adenosine modification protein YjeE
MTVTVRPATPDDGAVVRQLTGEAMPGCPGGALLAVAADRPVAALRHWPDPSQPTRLHWLGQIVVAPERRRSGIATALIAAAGHDAAEHGYTALRARLENGPDADASAGRRLLVSLGWQLLEADGRTQTYGLPLPRATPDAAAMRRLGERIAAVLRAGDLLVLTGPLGAGKTTLAQGIGAGLSVPDRITSPTFVLAREHAGRIPLVHVDAFRLGSLTDLDDLDLDTAMTDTVTLVEWGEGLVEGLTEGHLSVQLSRSDDAADELRWVLLRSTGPAWAARQQLLDTKV